tara:strand:+ start:351 stop:554 length:204 start_codon:yes stop_codon:yes gene_type:complete
MKKNIDIKELAYILARNKIEKKYKKNGYSPYISVYEEYVGYKLTRDAQKLFDKEYAYFYKTLEENSK